MKSILKTALAGAGLMALAACGGDAEQIVGRDIENGAESDDELAVKTELAAFVIGGSRGQTLLKRRLTQLSERSRRSERTDSKPSSAPWIR